MQTAEARGVCCAERVEVQLALSPEKVCEEPQVPDWELIHSPAFTRVCEGAMLTSMSCGPRALDMLGKTS